jgi:biotin/methionine sulfoxide reductase
VKALPIGRELTSSHWGASEVIRDGGSGGHGGRAGGPARGLRPLPDDPDPSPIGAAMWDAYQSPLRVRRPAVRAGWLEAHGQGRRGPHTGRGREAFVEVSWDEAIELVAGELGRVIGEHGNEAVFGGSYGWSSAGRFHHAQSQVHRFLNSLGGYVRHVDSYSLGAGRVLLPHVVCTMDYLLGHHHSWDVLVASTRLMVSFGGVPAKNAQVGSGGASRHHTRGGLTRLAAAGCRFVNFSPVRDNLDAPDASVEWIPIRPNTDTAVMLALACETVLAGRHDRAFLASHCVGFERWHDYLTGRADGIVKNADWAAAIAQVPAQRLRDLAREMAQTRSLVNVAWALQRADHGEQAFWSGVGLAAVLGQIGLPGGGFALAYGPTNGIGSGDRLMGGPTLPQGRNPVDAFIPVARIADLLLSPGAEFDYNGKRHRYPDIRLVYWAGGNPFHHHQDLNRLARAWQKPDTVVVHEQVWNATARMADIVLPATSTLEREDIGHASRDPYLISMQPALAPPGQARDDFAIFADLAARLGRGEAFTEGRSANQWLRWMYEQAARGMTEAGVQMPSFEDFQAGGGVAFPVNDRPVVLLADFRADPLAHPLKTPSGRIELFSARIDSFGYADCPGHPAWFEPTEWLGSAQALRHPLHLISDQPHTKLHSQLDHSAVSLANKVAGREPVMMHPADAAVRGIADGDVVRLFNDRGACLAGARLSEDMRPGVVKLSTGAWWDPAWAAEGAQDPPAPADGAAPSPGPLDRHGNPNVLTRDAGASSLSQGCSAQSCLVQIERLAGEAPPMRAFEPPVFLARGG